MKIDPEIRHVTKPGANLFLELGFSSDEAKRLQAASRKQINDTRLLKQQLMQPFQDARSAPNDLTEADQWALGLGASRAHEQCEAIAPMKPTSSPWA